MSTVNPLSQSPQTSLESEQRAHEPSMEEILASIRRIIADDDALPLTRRPSLVPREGVVATSEHPIDFPRSSAVPGPSGPPVHLVAVASRDFGLAEPPDTQSGFGASSKPLAASEESEADATRDVAAPRAPLGEDSFEEAQDAAIAHPVPESRVAGPSGSAWEKEHSPLVSPSTDASVSSSFQSLAASMFLRDSDLLARTAREMLRPMLKQWLDDNLPVMVERLVRAEIERVARGGR